MIPILKFRYLLLLSTGILVSCQGNQSTPSIGEIEQLHLKTGEIISCGPPDKEFGTVVFDITADKKTKTEFNTGMELLHSFEYDEAEKVFARIIEESPGSAMAYWGVAMCSFHPLWEPPSETDLRKGEKAIQIAKAIQRKSERESGYIEAVTEYYKDWNKTNARARSVRFEKAMEALHDKFPDDPETAIFYALALDAAADPADKSYANQKKAGDLLNALYQTEPNHPGIIHYIIHTYDYPGIAGLALNAAKRYAEVAPSSAHALHMPSHIFTRLGLWDECIQSNLHSVSAAKCYAESAGIKGSWDEELHGLDYLIYAYLQKGDNERAREQLKYLSGIGEVYPVNFKCAYTFAAAPSRLALENKNWGEATRLSLHPAQFPWNRFPWQEAILHFARLLGAAHQGETVLAESELARLVQLHDTLVNQKDEYKAKQVAIQVKTGEAWIYFLKGSKKEALEQMKNAADMEDSTSKHPVTPGEVLPARELYADMLFQLDRFETALQQYERVLQKCPNRFNSLYGAGRSAENCGKKEKARLYFIKLKETASPVSERSELLAVNTYLKTQ